MPSSTTQSKIQNRLKALTNNLAKEFELSKISKSPARFNMEKLTWFNREYIKMMNLTEFCYRASQLKIDRSKNNNTNNLEGKNLRIGDYVYFVDTKTQKIFANKNKTSRGQDGQFYCVGGGRDNGETSHQGLIREVLEETSNQSKGKIQLDPNKLIPLANIKVASQSVWISKNQKIDGKDMTFYVYELAVDELDSYVETEEGCVDKWLFDWYEISDMIATNDYVTYPIWQEICNSNNLVCFEPNETIKRQYLAWNLDKNRATTLLDFGTESGCVLQYITCDIDDLKWKKISLQESLDNLLEILGFINQSYPEIYSNSHFDALAINEVPQYFDQSVTSWEAKIKNWLKENNKDTGSYLWPLRVALSGKAKSPSPFELLSVLSQEQVNKRILRYTTSNLH